MQITITLTSKEMTFLQKMVARHRYFEKKQYTVEDAVHECIGIAMFDEAEHAQQHIPLFEQMQQVAQFGQVVEVRLAQQA